MRPIRVCKRNSDRNRSSLSLTSRFQPVCSEARAGIRRRESAKRSEKRVFDEAHVAEVFARGTLLVAFAQAWAHLNVDRRVGHGLRALLQPEVDAVVVRAPEEVFDGEAALDLALARFIRRAIGRVLGRCSVTVITALR